jgi:DNA-binding Xre family transcriptional regulator
MLSDILIEYKISLFELSKGTKVPYSTLSNIKLEKTDTRKITADTLYRLSRYLNISMEELYLKLNDCKKKNLKE